MKPVKGSSTDSYAHESESGTDAVFARMLEVVGNPPGSYAMAFDVSENTIKTWRRRGAISLRYLEGFAKEHGTTIDYLLHGRSGAASSQDAPLSNEEKLLLERFRASSRELRDAVLRVLLGGDSMSGTTQTFHETVSGGVAGRDIVKTGRKRKE